MADERRISLGERRSEQNGLRFFSPTGVVHITDDGRKRYFESRSREIKELGIVRAVGVKTEMDFEPEEVGLILEGSEVKVGTAKNINENDNLFIFEVRVDPGPSAPIVCQLQLPGGCRLESIVQSENGYGTTSEWELLGRGGIRPYWFFVPADSQFLSKIRVSFHS